MDLFILLLPTPTPSPTAIAAHVPERTPALLTIVYVAGLFLLVLLLLAMLIRLWITNRRKWASNQQLPREVRRRLGSTTTNRGLQALRILFVLLAISVFSF